MARSLFIGADHRGFFLKKSILDWVHTIPDLVGVDCGNSVEDPNDSFATYAFAVAERVRDTPTSRGLLICHSSVGMCIAANKVRGIRAGEGLTVAQVVEDRQHNDFQVLCLSSETSIEMTKQLLLAFLNTEFSGLERYAQRIAQITEYERKQ